MRQPANIYKTPLKDIWNSAYLKNVRKLMAEGRPVPACSLCAKAEAAGGMSRRLKENVMWTRGSRALPGVSIEELINRGIENGFVLNHPPIDLMLMVGNMCNSACRMCDGVHSSRIEHDPIHSVWSDKEQFSPEELGYDVMATWHKDQMILVPQTPSDAEVSGFQPLVSSRNEVVLLVEDKASIILTGLRQDIASIKISFAPDASCNETIEILLNNMVIYNGSPAGNDCTHQINFEKPIYIEDFHLQFQVYSGKGVMPAENKGAIITRLHITRQEIHRQQVSPQQTNSKEIALSRFPGKRRWLQEKDFLYGELLNNMEMMRHISLTGGEPAVIPEVVELIEYIYKHTQPGALSLGFSTNAAMYKEELFKYSNHFRAQTVQISLDGLNEAQEYIRYGVKWQPFKTNLLQIIEKVRWYRISYTFSAYNLLSLPGVLRFCDENAIQRIHIGFASSPSYTSAKAIPPKVRRTAIKQLRTYIHDDSHSQTTAELAQYAVDRLEQMKDDFDLKALHDFMAFTNDLDRSRGQSIHKTFPDLVRLIEEAGYPWVNDTRCYANQL